MPRTANSLTTKPLEIYTLDAPMKKGPKPDLPDKANPFVEWLVTNYDLSRKSATDVASRAKRASQMLSVSRLTASSESELLKSRAFAALSYTVKCQLKRAVRLAADYACQTKRRTS
jgi:hypothetical protein